MNVCPTLTLVIFTRLPELSPFVVLKYSYPSTVPLCFPRVLSSHSNPSQISFSLKSFLCLRGPTYFILAVFSFNSTLFPNKLEVSAVADKFIFGYFNVIKGSYDSTTFVLFSNSNLEINSSVFAMSELILFLSSIF